MMKNTDTQMPDMKNIHVLVDFICKIFHFDADMLSVTS